MKSPSSHVLMGGIADVLGSVRKKGVTLWSDNGQLRYKAPKGALTQEEMESLRMFKSQIVSLLDKRVDAEETEPRFCSRPRLDSAPVAFSQLARWYMHRLDTQPSIRQVASATRLCGPLNINALQRSVSEVVRRHDALRTRIVVCDGIPVQKVAESSDCELRAEDLTALSEAARETTVHRLIEELILEPIDISVDPLFRVRLLRLRDDEHVLMVVMDHMISDGFSRGIVLRDLFTAYVQALRGKAFCLPEIPVQFTDYAISQSNARDSWIERHSAYWNDRLRGCQRLRFPESKNLSSGTSVGWGNVPLHIGPELKAKLQEWCRLRRTTLVMSVFTAYIGLVLRWCNVSETVVQYQSDGRVSPEVENTVGFFASALYLRVDLREGDTFVDLLGRVTKEYCEAHEHADFSYLSAQAVRPDFTRNTAFNWVPQGSEIDLAGTAASGDAITCSVVPFEHPMLRKLDLDNEPSILLYDFDEEVVGSVHFPINRFSRGTMERFAQNFLVFIEALLRQREERVKDVLLV